MIIILYALLVVLVHGCPPQPASARKKEWPTGIQAANRLKIYKFSKDNGNLMRAEVGTGHVNQAQVPIKFLGPLTTDKRAAFYIEKTNGGKCPFICTMRCELGVQNTSYYLTADNGKIFLSKLNVQGPKDNKFMFEIKVASDGGHFFTIMSLSTGMYLASDRDGNPSLKKFTKQPKAVPTWFHFLPHLADYKCYAPSL